MIDDGILLRHEEKGAELSLLALAFGMDPLLQKVSEESLHQILRAFLFLPTVIILPFVP